MSNAGGVFTDLTMAMVGDGVVLVTLARPQVRNALRHQTMIELADALARLDQDESVRCIVLTGGDRAFAAGADIGEMVSLDGEALREHPRTLAWQRIWQVRCPLVAAVEGWALGGGCELVLSCDVAVAAEGARFGQPEITLGWMPGAGGTQRLAKSVGKSATMQMVLTGDAIDAPTALRIGMVSEVVPDGAALSRATAIAQRVASHPREATRKAKQAVLTAFETSLRDGLRDEHQAFRELANSEERQRLMHGALLRSRQ